MKVQPAPRRRRHHLVPNPHTKQRATFLSQHFLALYALVLFTFISYTNQAHKSMPGVLSYASNININTLLDETNKIRQQKGLSTLKMNQSLSNAAAKKAQHMFKNNYWAHVAPDGTEPWFFILNEKYDYSYAGENLAKNFNNSRDVVEAWYKSPSHRENLLNSNYDDIGFAVVNGVLDGYETTLVVQMFGRSRYPVAVVDNNVQGVDVQTPENVFEPVQIPTPVKGDSNISALPPTNQFSPEEIVVYKPPFTIHDLGSFNRLISFAFGGFLVLLLALDIWYSRKHVIFKPTGHTLAHIVFLTILVLSILFLIKPGVVL
jgi:uncharacterized protein YkwD